jgi:hypothetical protein
MTYAASTTVPIERSKAEIERMVCKYGAQGFVSGWSDDGRAAIEFAANDRRLRFTVSAPDPRAKEFTHRKHNSGKEIERPEAEAHRLWEQACRSLWRALCLCIKAKLEAVESGITTFETEFMPYTVLPGGKTAMEHVGPMIEQAYTSGKVPPLQLGYDG